MAATRLSVALALGCALASAQFDPFLYISGFNEGLCASGMNQTPINLPPLAAVDELEVVPMELETVLEFPTVSGAFAVNAGNGLKVLFTCCACGWLATAC